MYLTWHVGYMRRFLRCGLRRWYAPTIVDFRAKLALTCFFVSQKLAYFPIETRFSHRLPQPIIISSRQLSLKRVPTSRIFTLCCLWRVGAVQVRLVIWKCKDVVSMDFASGLNDLFVKAWLEGCQPQVSTIRHYSSSTLLCRVLCRFESRIDHCAGRSKVFRCSWVYVCVPLC